MAATDLFLRSKPKARATDLWLHPAGADGATPAEPFDSGTNAAIALLGSVERLAASETLTTFAGHSANEALLDRGGVTLSAGHSALTALSDVGATGAAAILSGLEALQAGGVVLLDQEGLVVATLTFSAAEALLDRGTAAGLVLNQGTGKLVLAPGAQESTVSYDVAVWNPVVWRNNRMTESMPFDQRAAEEVALIKLGRVPRKR